MGTLSPRLVTHVRHVIHIPRLNVLQCFPMSFQAPNVALVMSLNVSLWCAM